MSLPDAPLRAFEEGTQAALAGFADLAGLSTAWEVAFLPRQWKHPWLGLTVVLPNGTGKISRCLNHPRGYFTFDVEYPNPVPPLSGQGQIVLADNPAYHQMSHRYSALELQRLAQ